MLKYYIIEIIQSGTFDIILNSMYLISLWILMTIRLDRIERKYEGK